MNFAISFGRKRIIPTLEERAPSNRPPNVMAGLDPAIHTPTLGGWMPRPIPGLDPGTGMTIRVTTYEVWDKCPSAKTASAGPNSVSRPRPRTG
jgi:hypothetical protein